MRISGLRKMTLLDFPDRVACTVFTGGCDLRCPFCHNASLVLPERASDETDESEVLRFLEKRRGMLEGVAVTGGEPLLHADLPDFLRKLRAMGYAVKLDTNGTFPDRLRAVVEEGLVDYVAMDVKNAPLLYGKTVGLRDFDLTDVERSKDLLLAGCVRYEFRTTVVRGLHTAESLCAAARWIEGAQAYFLQQYKDSGDVLRPDGLGSFTDDEMRDLLHRVRTVLPAARLRGVDE